MNLIFLLPLAMAGAALAIGTAVCLVWMRGRFSSRATEREGGDGVAVWLPLALLLGGVVLENPLLILVAVLLYPVLVWWLGGKHLRPVADHARRRRAGRYYRSCMAHGRRLVKRLRRVLRQAAPESRDLISELGPGADSLMARLEKLVDRAARVDRFLVESERTRRPSTAVGEPASDHASEELERLRGDHREMLAKIDRVLDELESIVTQAVRVTAKWTNDVTQDDRQVTERMNVLLDEMEQFNAHMEARHQGVGEA